MNLMLGGTNSGLGAMTLIPTMTNEKKKNEKEKSIKNPTLATSNCYIYGKFKSMVTCKVFRELVFPEIERVSLAGTSNRRICKVVGIRQSPQCEKICFRGSKFSCATLWYKEDYISKVKYVLKRRQDIYSFMFSSALK